MPNIFKVFSRTKAEPYRFPDAAGADSAPAEEGAAPAPARKPRDTAALDAAALETLLASLPAFEEGAAEEEDPEEFAELILGGGDRPAPPPEEAPPPNPPQEEEAPPPEPTPVDFARIQADKILEQARQEAESILEQARLKAEAETAAAVTQAREAGFQEGYLQGMTKAVEEGRQQREKQAEELEKKVEKFLERAGSELDRQMDQSVDDLRDLAMAVAEKVVCVSLKSSADVISRMIQTAIDKRKRKEWVHIYISECDARRLSQVPVSLTKALNALSDRVRIIPMADDESGTCIIEMPDEIVDASAATQLNNLRTIIMDTANSASGTTLF